ncbi:MAG: hypothetical protein NWF01_12020 [Candidatus Bathyarchaeota archaeon]|nr:hypothetical protein [Candidatus Bathyarchaeota archaeon]
MTTEKEISQKTLKQLHTLGNQKFGSSPFSDHFDRWLINVETVLSEFEAHPDITVDEQYEKEGAQTLNAIKLQLEEFRQKEAILDHEQKILSYCKSNLKQININYTTLTNELRQRKNHKNKPLHSSIEQLKKEQTQIIKMKAGFLRGISKKEREQKEFKIAEELDNKQKELEVALLDFRAQQKLLQNKYHTDREPVLEQIMALKKKIRDLETDNSLEERWFACQALIDTVNIFLQRKALID